MKRSTATALLIALAAALGCGDDGEEQRAAFVSDANAICQDRQDAVKRIQGGFETDKGAYDRAVNDELARLRKLDPPKGWQDDWSRLLKLYEDSIRTELRAAKVNEDPDSTVEERTSVGELYARANRSG